MTFESWSIKMRVLRYSFPLRFLSASSSDFLFSIVFPHLFFPVRTKMLRYDQGSWDGLGPLSSGIRLRPLFRNVLHLEASASIPGRLSSSRDPWLWYYPMVFIQWISGATFLEWFRFFQCLVDQHNLIKILNRIWARLYWTGQLVETVIKLFSPRMSDFQHTGFTLHQPCMFSNQVHTKLLQWWQVAMLTKIQISSTIWT